jgi:hypothetical protein
MDFREVGQFFSPDRDFFLPGRNVFARDFSSTFSLLPRGPGAVRGHVPLLFNQLVPVFWQITPQEA